MLSELGASPSSNSGLVSSSTEPHLKLVIASVDLWNERRRNGSSAQNKIWWSINPPAPQAKIAVLWRLGCDFPVVLGEFSPEIIN
jgi:hypothetical protein